MTTPLVHPPHLLTNARYETNLTRYHKGSYRRQAGEIGREVLDALRSRQFGS